MIQPLHVPTAGGHGHCKDKRATSCFVSLANWMVGWICGRSTLGVVASVPAIPPNSIDKFVDWVEQSQESLRSCGQEHEWVEVLWANPRTRRCIPWPQQMQKQMKKQKQEQRLKKRQWQSHRWCSVAHLRLGWWWPSWTQVFRHVWPCDAVAVSMPDNWTELGSQSRMMLHSQQLKWLMSHRCREADEGRLRLFVVQWSGRQSWQYQFSNWRWDCIHATTTSQELHGNQASVAWRWTKWCLGTSHWCSRRCSSRLYSMWLFDCHPFWWCMARQQLECCEHQQTVARWNSMWNHNPTWWQLV